MIVLNVDRLSVSFGATPILREVSFALDESDRLGIIGANGCGKSTLLRLITGELEPDEGQVFFSKNKTIGILRQDDAFLDFREEDRAATALEVMLHSFPQLLEAEARLAVLERAMQEGDPTRTRESLVSEYTALHERFVAEGGLEFRGRCASTLQKMGFDREAMERPFSSLSGGQRTRLALSRELCREPDVLMLDEPTNHLDTETLSWLESFLSAYKKCVIVISHDRYFLDRVTTKTLCIEFGRARLYRGNYTKSMAQRATDREIALRHYENQQREIARQEAYIAQQRQWNRERNIIAAESRQKLLDKMERLERPEDAPAPISFAFTSSGVSGNDVLTVEGLSFSYGSVPLLRGLSFLIKRGDRAFVVGPNGCGKSTLIKLLLGKLTPNAGYVETGYGVKIAYYDQENQNLTPTSTVLEELWQSAPARTQTEIRSTLARFRFFGDDVFKTVSELSGGERARLTLCKLLLSDMNLLILDEPTNHLDIDSREALESALEEFEGTVIVVSHDRYLIDKLATRLLDLRREGLHDFRVQRKGRAYGELLAERERLAPQSAQSPFPDTSSGGDGLSQKEQYLRAKQETAQARKEQRRLERLRRESEELEARLDEIETEMNGEAAYDYQRLAELDTEKNKIEERLLEIWEEL